MKYKLLCLLFICMIGLTSAGMTEDLFSDKVTNLDIMISNNYSEVNFFFNSTNMSWDKFSIDYQIDNETNIKLDNLYLSSLLDAFNFRIENNSSIEFTSFNIKEGSFLQIILDNILNESFTISDLNTNLILVNSFFELDNDYPYQYFEKSGNNFIYEINKGHDNFNISEIVNEAVGIFEISNILSDLGIENIYDLNFTMEIIGIEDALENGYYELELLINDGELNKTIGLTLEGIEVEEVVIEEVIVPVEEKKSSSSSSRRKEVKEFIIEPEEEPKEIIKKDPIIINIPEPEKETNYLLISLIVGILFLIVLITIIIIKKRRKK